MTYEFLLKEIHRVLKKDGFCLITVPLVWNEHEVPYDFFRFTQYFYKHILPTLGFDILKLNSSTKFFSTIGQLLSAFLFETLGKGTILKMFCAVFICFPIQAFLFF